MISYVTILMEFDWLEQSCIPHENQNSYKNSLVKKICISWDKNYHFRRKIDQVLKIWRENNVLQMLGIFVWFHSMYSYFRHGIFQTLWSYYTVLKNYSINRNGQLHVSLLSETVSPRSINWEGVRLLSDFGRSISNFLICTFHGAEVLIFQEQKAAEPKTPIKTRSLGGKNCHILHVGLFYRILFSNFRLSFLQWDTY